MKAIVYDGSPTPVLREVKKPAPRDGEALLRVKRAGICGTDLSIVSGKHPRAQPGLIMGHEIAATIEEIDEGGTDLRPGQLVTLEPTLSCGRCVACRMGNSHVCQNLKLYGIDVPGGMAQYVVVNTDRLHAAPIELPEELLVLSEPFAVATHALRMSGIRFGDRVCVIGGGPIGLLTALLARDAGARLVVISEPQESRRAVAEHAGFEVVNPRVTTPESHIAFRTGGEGADVVFECAGSQPAVSAATQVARPGGMVVQVSIPKTPREVSLTDLTFKEVKVQGVRVYATGDFEKALSVMSRYSQVLGEFTSEPFDMDQAGAAFDAARAGDRGLRIGLRIGD